MIKFIFLFIFLVNTSFAHLTTRFNFAMAKFPTICSKASGTYDGSTLSGACLYTTGISETLCSIKGFKKLGQVYIPANSGVGATFTFLDGDWTYGWYVQKTEANYSPCYNTVLYCRNLYSTCPNPEQSSAACNHLYGPQNGNFRDGCSVLEGNYSSYTQTCTYNVHYIYGWEPTPNSRYSYVYYTYTATPTKVWCQ